MKAAREVNVKYTHLGNFVPIAEIEVKLYHEAAEIFVCHQRLLVNHR